MKKLAFVISVLMISSINIFSQFSDDVMINPFWSFYSDNYLDAVSSGKGFTGIASMGSISGINHNPASLEIPRKYQAGIQYTYRLDQSWLPYLGLNDLNLSQNLFSGSAGFGFRINKQFQAGVLYSNPASMTLNSWKMIITNEFGQEIGSYDAYDKYVVHSISVPVVFSTERLRVGVNLNYSLHRRYMNFNDSELVGKFDKFNAQLGLIVAPAKGLSIGATFTPKVSGTVKSSFPSVANEQGENAIIPMKIGAGIDYMIKGNLWKISADYNYTNLSARDGLKDRHQVNLGLEYFADKHWTFRTGFFNVSDPRDFSHDWGYSENYDYKQYFLTIGATFKTPKVDASIGIMDSHISSGEIKNTFVNAGLTLNF